MVHFLDGTDIGVDAQGGLFLNKQSRIRVYRNLDQTIGASPTKVQFEVETFDNLGEYDNATNYRFTALTNGIYLVTTTVRWSGGSDAIADVWIYRNGSPMAGRRVVNGSANEEFSVGVTDLITLSASQYIEVFAAQYSGMTGAKGGAASTWLALQKIS